MRSEMTPGCPSIHQVGESQFAEKGMMTALASIATGEALNAGSSPGNILDDTGHSVQQYDFIRFTSGTYSGKEFLVVSIPSANSIKIDTSLDPAPGADTYDILRPVTLTVGSDGTVTITAASLRFDLNGSATVVSKDTGTPANNIPLPIEIIDTTGVVDVRTLLTNIQDDLALIEADTDVINTNVAAILARADIEPVDFLDTGIVDAGTTAITTAGITVVASLAADVKEIEINDDIGDHMALTDGSDNIICYLSNTAISSRRKVNIASGTSLKIRSMSGASLTSGKITMNFLG